MAADGFRYLLKPDTPGPRPTLNSKSFVGPGGDRSEPAFGSCSRKSNTLRINASVNPRFAACAAVGWGHDQAPIASNSLGRSRHWGNGNLRCGPCDVPVDIVVDPAGVQSFSGTCCAAALHHKVGSGQSDPAAFTICACSGGKQGDPAGCRQLDGARRSVEGAAV